MVLKNALRLTPAISECQAISRDFNTTMEGRPAQQAMPSRCTELDPGGHSIILVYLIATSQQSGVLFAIWRMATASCCLLDKLTNICDK
jgi:hypothetical protein